MTGGNTVKLFSLKGKTAVIIGASRGIGRSLTLGLAEAGADLVLASRSKESLEETASLAEKKHKVKAHSFVCDIIDRGQVEDLKKEALSLNGQVDILVNSQGLNIKKLALDLSGDDWTKIIQVNLDSVFTSCQVFGSHMVEKGTGKIINIASMSSFVGIHRSSAYSASKGGVMQLTKVLAMEWASSGVKVNCIAPGFFYTELTAPVFNDKAVFNRLMERTPLGRAGKVEELMGACIYLASPASDYVTGITLPVDGGFLAYGI